MQSRERYFPFAGGLKRELGGFRRNAPYIVELHQKTNTPYIKERREYKAKRSRGHMGIVVNLVFIMLISRSLL